MSASSELVRILAFSAFWGMILLGAASGWIVGTIIGNRTIAALEKTGFERFVVRFFATMRDYLANEDTRDIIDKPAASVQA